MRPRGTINVMELLLAIVVGGFSGLSLVIIGLLSKASRTLNRLGVNERSDLPSVSVCIPARNEAHALSACLDRVLASDYEKLEILVLDDESVDQTPTLIKSFAHAGVRFIAGKPLPDGWIGKNHALDTMAREASGEIILFLDVDVQISTQTISRLIASMADDEQILSVIPQRRDTYRVSALFGHMRYLWDLTHVGMGGKSASASLWCVRRTWLLDILGGFESVRSDIRPELTLVSDENTHSAYVLGDELGVGYEKHWHSQIESSERLLIPTLRSNGFGMNIVVTWLLVGMIALPLLFAVAWHAPTETTIGLFYGVFILGYCVQFAYLRLAWQSRAWLGGLMWWWTVAQEVTLIVASTIRYATKTVSWKGRSIHAQPENDDYYSI